MTLLNGSSEPAEGPDSKQNHASDKKVLKKRPSLEKPGPTSRLIHRHNVLRNQALSQEHFFCEQVGF